MNPVVSPMDSDVIIVGAGPAGSTAAKHLAEKGRDVLVLEKDRLPRDKACGGGVVRHATRFEYIRDFLEERDAEACRAHRSYDSSLKYFVEYHTEDVLFYNVRRREFDQELMRFALEAGANVREDAMVTDVGLEGDSVRVVTREGDELTARVVIGASGVMDPVARYIRRAEGLPEDGGDIAFAAVEEYPVDRSLIDERYPDHMSYFHHGFDGLTYGWVFPKQDVLNIGIWPKAGEKVDIRASMERYLDHLGSEGLIPEGLKVVRPLGAPLPSAGPMEVSYSDRMIIAGDAARMVSPLTGEGIYYAMESGRMAALTIDEALAKGQPDPAHLSPYQEMWSSTFGQDLKALLYYAEQVAKHGTLLIKMAQEDPVLRKLYANLFMGTIDAAGVRTRVLTRMAINAPKRVVKAVLPRRIARRL